jgi:hypothetical protein
MLRARNIDLSALSGRIVMLRALSVARARG